MKGDLGTDHVVAMIPSQPTPTAATATAPAPLLRRGEPAADVMRDEFLWVVDAFLEGQAL